MTKNSFVAEVIFNLKNKTTKIEHKKIFCGLSKFFKKFHGPSIYV